MKNEILNKIFTKNRVPREIIIKAFYEYIGSKNGLRTVAWFNGLTHQALWYWVKRIKDLREDLHKRVCRRGVPKIIVVDETEIHTTQGTLYLWFALDPYDKTLLGFSITKGRSIIECLLTFRYWFRCWGSKPLIVLTDGGKWYGVLDRLGVLWVTLRGGIRSYIERFVTTLKSYRWLVT
ncbi:MAG: hypothetical protein ACTSYD_14315 [Candidatus Heimdallarchaeaceae archaeon]